MPQDITLYNEFNISETIEFFGMLHNMSKNYIKERKNFLLEFLKLPPSDKLIRKLRFLYIFLLIKYFIHFIWNIYKY